MYEVEGAVSQYSGKGHLSTRAEKTMGQCSRLTTLEVWMRCGSPTNVDAVRGHGAAVRGRPWLQR